jgi:hypothetical protein
LWECKKVNDQVLYPFSEPVAQSVEHRPFKARALGSSPSRLTTSNQGVVLLRQPLFLSEIAYSRFYSRLTIS